jgi:hypothetical protein
MKKLSLIIFAALLVIPGAASAHEVESDGSISAFMHVTPADHPTAGRPASFYFDISDNQNKFSPEACHCIFTIEQSGKQVYQQDLFPPGQSDALVNYTFQATGDYEVKISGHPRTPDAFQLFTLTYELSVGTPGSLDGPPLWQILLAVAAVAAPVTFFFVRNSTKKSKNKQS